MHLLIRFTSMLLLLVSPAFERVVGPFIKNLQRLGIEDHSAAPPPETFADQAEKRVRLGLLVRQLISDNNLSVDEARVRQHVEDICAGYENAEDMVEMYMNNPQLRQQIEPVVLEEIALDFLMEQGKVKTRKVKFKDFMDN